MAKPKNKPGPTDTVPALLTPGEHVMNREAVALLGAENLERANKMGLAMRNQVQGFAAGGGVIPTRAPDDVINYFKDLYRGGDQSAINQFNSADLQGKQQMMKNSPVVTPDTQARIFTDRPNEASILQAGSGSGGFVKSTGGIYATNSPEYKQFQEADAKRTANFNTIQNIAATEYAQPNSAINRTSWQNEFRSPESVAASNSASYKPAYTAPLGQSRGLGTVGSGFKSWMDKLDSNQSAYYSDPGKYDDGVPVNSILAQERRNKGIYTPTLAPRGGLGFSEGGEVPYYHQPGARNVYAGRDLQPSPVAAIQPAAQIKNAGQPIMRDGSSYYGKPSAKPLSRPVDKASLPAPPVMIPSQATNAIRGDVASAQQALTPGQMQQQESARAWQRAREEAPAPVPGVDLAPVEYGPKFRHGNDIDVGVQGFSRGGEVERTVKIQDLPGMRDLANRIKYPEAFDPGAPNQTHGFDPRVNPGSRQPVIRPTAVPVDGPYVNVPPRSTIEAGKQITVPRAMGMQPMSERVLNINDPSLGNQRVFGSQIDRPGNTSGFRVQSNGLQTTAQPGTGWTNVDPSKVYSDSRALVPSNPAPSNAGPQSSFTDDDLARAKAYQQRTKFNPSAAEPATEYAPRTSGLLQRASDVVDNMGGQMATATGIASQLLQNPMIANQINDALARHGMKGIIATKDQQGFTNGGDWSWKAGESSGAADQQPRSNYAPTLADMGMNSQGKLDIPVQQPPAINPETKAWGDRSIANIREGERNRMAAREKMQSVITDRQARAQAGLDARAAQQAQHQAWLDRPVDYAQGGSSPSYSQRPDGAIMRNGQAVDMKLPAPRSREDEQAIKERLDDMYTRHQLRNNPQALAAYAASRGDNAASRYQVDKSVEISANERADKNAQFDKEYGLKEQQLLSEDQYRKGIIGVRAAEYEQQASKAAEDKARQGREDRTSHEDHTRKVFTDLYSGRRDAKGQPDKIYAENAANEMEGLIATYADKIRGAGLGNYDDGFSKNQAIRLKAMADEADSQARTLLKNSSWFDPTPEQVKAKKQELFLQQLLAMAPKAPLPTDEQEVVE